VFLIGLFFLGSYLVKNENQNLKNTDLIYSPNSMRKGSEKASVVVTEFFDPECESCREFQPYLNSLLNDYDGRIQLVLRYAPFHTNSIFAVKILEAAREQNQYWETLQILYKFQPEWGSHDHPRPELIWGYLNSLNLDINKLKVDMESERIKNLIDNVLETYMGR
jgi:protein-disulfide isomerase